MRPETSAWGFYFYYSAPNPTFVSFIYLFTFISGPLPPSPPASAHPTATPPSSLPPPATAATGGPRHRPSSLARAGVSAAGARYSRRRPVPLSALRGKNPRALRGAVPAKIITLYFVIRLWIYIYIYTYTRASRSSTSLVRSFYFFIYLHARI